MRQSQMQQLLISALLMITMFNVNSSPAQENLPPASEFMEQIKDVPDGIGVVLGDKQMNLTTILTRKWPGIVYLQFPQADDSKAASQAADKLELYGERIFVATGNYDRIHLADNIADFAIILGEFPREYRSEIRRILQPGGKAIRLRNGQLRSFVKPVPQGLDNWSHPYHGPDNNPRSDDEIVKGPYLTQFLADPRYGPLPQIALASEGRIFKAFGHIAFKVREEPLLNTLVTFNGYNGAELWRHALSPTYMIHRNTMVALDGKVYVADDKACTVLDAATGKVLDKIIPDPKVSGGTFWKWMAIEAGTIYAMIGEQEQVDPIVKQKRQVHGWPWNPLSKGFNQPNQPWGYGKTILAIDPDTKKVLWHHKEDTPMDARATCMKNGRIYIFGFGKYLACLDSKTGNDIWRQTLDNCPELFAALGKYSNRQDWRTNWRTTAYLKCSDQALYFAGPQVEKLLAVSTEDGRILWEDPYNNFQLIIHDDKLFGISGQIDDGHASKVFEPMTGKVLAELPLGRRACTRPTSALDAIFFRASGGSSLLNTSTHDPQLISPMRPPCQDGVTIANGLLYWWPSVCDCNLTLYGVTSLGPAGDFDFKPTTRTEERLEKTAGDISNITPLDAMKYDWPTFRGNNRCTAITSAQAPGKGKRAWNHKLANKSVRLTAPVAVGGMAFVGGENGCVWAYYLNSGDLAWKAYTGGAIRVAPTFWNRRIYVGSGDGYVYCLEAKTGRRLWRFRVAQQERVISVYGKLMSTWPVGSGVMVDRGVAYAAGGIVNYDGTYVFALDAVTGEIKWQNNSSGHLNDNVHTGVSVQGHMLMFGDTLCLAGGNAVSPATYDIHSGKCTNNIEALQRRVQNNVLASMSPRGWELYEYGNGVFCCGKPFYAHPEYGVYDQTVFQKTHLAATKEYDYTWVNNSKVLCYPKITKDRQKILLASWGKPAMKGVRSKWQYNCPESAAFALCKNAVLVAGKKKVTALHRESGDVIWQVPLAHEPVLWGMAVDGKSRIILTLKNGQIVCIK